MKGDTPSPLRIPKAQIVPEGTSFPFIRKGWDTEALVFGTGNQVHAYINRCPHLPLTLDIGTGSFFTQDGSELLCANHGARFLPENGECTWGPCKGHSLTPIPFTWSSDGEFLLLKVDAVDKERPSKAEVLGEE